MLVLIAKLVLMSFQLKLIRTLPFHLINRWNVCIDLETEAHPNDSQSKEWLQHLSMPLIIHFIISKEEKKSSHFTWNRPHRQNRKLKCLPAATTRRKVQSDFLRLHTDRQIIFAFCSISCHRYAKFVGWITMEICF